MTNISLVLKLPALCCVFKKWEVCCVCMCVYFKGIFICGFSLMNPNPFLRKQFISGKLVSTQEPVCQEEGDSLETFCGSVCQCWTQSPGTRGRQRQRRHTHSHPADQSTACCMCGNYTHTHTHCNRVQKPRGGCNQASWQVYPSDTDMVEEKSTAFPRISRIHVFMHAERRCHCFSPLSSIIKCELSASLESYEGVRFYYGCHRDLLES